MLRSTGAETRSTFIAMNESSQPTELLLSVSKGAPGTLGSQIEGQLRGRFARGAPSRARPPSTRDLARQLGVSRRVVVDAYGQLAAEGYLSVRQGARPRVSAAAPPVDEPDGPRRARPARGASTSGPACPTSPRSRAPPGCAPCETRSRRSPTPTSSYGDHRRRRGAALRPRRLPRARARRRRRPGNVVITSGYTQGSPSSAGARGRVGRTPDRARVAGRSGVACRGPRRPRACAGRGRRGRHPRRSA